MGTTRSGVLSRRLCGAYGIDGDFEHVSAPVQAAGAGGIVTALAGTAGLGWRQGRREVAVLAGTLAVGALGSVVSTLYTSRRGKFRIWERILSQVGLSGTERVVDLGCGRGAVLCLAAERVPHGQAIGIDVWRPDQTGNTASMARANAVAEGVADRVQLHTAELTHLPITDHSLDLVVSNFALHNLPTTAGRQAAIDEAARVLRPGGHLGHCRPVRHPHLHPPAAPAGLTAHHPDEPRLAHVGQRPLAPHPPRHSPPAPQAPRQRAQTYGPRRGDPPRQGRPALPVIPGQPSIRSPPEGPDRGTVSAARCW